MATFRRPTEEAGATRHRPAQGGQARFRRATEGVSPVLTTMYLVASAFVLAGGFYVARDYYLHGQDDVPDIATWGDEGHDRILVVQGDEIAWQDLEIRTDRPARAALEGEVDLQDGTMSPGGRYVPLGSTDRPVIGGDALLLCAVGQAGPVLVSMRDAATHTTIFEQTLHVESCPVGDVGAGEAGRGQGRRA